MEGKLVLLSSDLVAIYSATLASYILLRVCSLDGWTGKSACRVFYIQIQAALEPATSPSQGQSTDLLTNVSH